MTNSFGELCVDIDDFLYLVVAAKEDTRPVVDVLGNDFDHALHVAVDGLTTRCVTNSVSRCPFEPRRVY